MGKKLKCIMLLAIVNCLFVGGVNVFAAENPFIKNPQRSVEIVSSADSDTLIIASNPTLLACNVGIGATDEGLVILFDTNATEKADEIGVKNITLYEKKPLGGLKEIPISNLSRSNSTFYSGSVVYTLAKEGTTYYVECTHYAKFGNTELTLDNISSELKYN